MARQLYADDPSLRFLFFGGGVMLEQMRNYVASLNLQGVIQLPGYTDETWNALAAMDVFVLTSRMEGLPNVLDRGSGEWPAGGLRQSRRRMRGIRRWRYRSGSGRRRCFEPGSCGAPHSEQR